jgi:TetR/AcrR family transcriptional regulator, lmrAB and yxaGH operons repressor
MSTHAKNSRLQESKQQPKQQPNKETEQDTRQRLIVAMQTALASRGFNGMGLNELLALAGAPKGVMYHHFPGGKTELALAAIELSTEQMLAQLAKVMSKSDSPAQAIQMWFDASYKILSAKNYEMGCPFAATALESTPNDIELRQAISSSFASVRNALSKALEKSKVPNSRPLAALIISAYEGALMQARVAQSAQPLKDALAALIPMLQRQTP